MKISAGQRWCHLPLRRWQGQGWDLGDSERDGAGHGAMSITFAGNWAFFSSPPCRKTCFLCSYGRARTREWLLLHRAMGPLWRELRRMNFPAVHCAFEDGVADVLAERDAVLSCSASMPMGHNLVRILFPCSCSFILLLQRRRFLRERFHLTQGL